MVAAMFPIKTKLLSVGQIVSLKKLVLLACPHKRLHQAEGFFKESGGIEQQEANQQLIMLVGKTCGNIFSYTMQILLRPSTAN